MGDSAFHFQKSRSWFRQRRCTVTGQIRASDWNLSRSTIVSDIMRWFKTSCIISNTSRHIVTRCFSGLGCLIGESQTIQISRAVHSSNVPNVGQLFMHLSHSWVKYKLDGGYSPNPYMNMSSVIISLLPSSTLILSVLVWCLRLVEFHWQTQTELSSRHEKVNVSLEMLKPRR